MKRLSIILVGLFPLLLCSSEGAQSTLDNKLQPPESVSIEPSTARLNFPGGYLDYLGKPSQEDSGKLQESLFGLSFHRPPVTNGGWDLWNVVRIWVTREGDANAYEVIGSQLLKDVQILEDTDQRIFEFRWPLADDAGQLVITFVQRGAQEDWLMMRIAVEGEGVHLQKIVLSAYPGNTTAPEERERWIAVGTERHQLEATPREIADAAQGLVLFNKMAQEETGCQLVVLPEKISRAQVKYDYAVAMTYEMEPETVEFQAALGGYLEQDSDEVVRVFAMEGARNMLNALKQTRWTPEIDEQTNQRLFLDLKAVIADIGSKEDVRRCLALEERYMQARENDNRLVLRESLSEGRQWMNALVTEALDRWK